MQRRQIIVAAAIVGSVTTIVGAMLIGSWRNADTPFAGVGVPVDPTQIARTCDQRRGEIAAQSATPVAVPSPQTITVGGVFVEIPPGLTLAPEPNAPAAANTWFYSHGAEATPVAGSIQVAVGVLAKSSPAGQAIAAQLAAPSGADDAFGDSGYANEQCRQPTPSISPSYPVSARASTESIAGRITMHQRGLLDLGDGRLVEVAVDGRADVVPYAAQFAVFRAAMESIAPAK